jgi:general secretion pathway protein G
LRRAKECRKCFSKQAGLTLLELIISCAILLILSSAALPIARYSSLRMKEANLRFALRSMREGIDRYKDAADHNQIKTEIGSEGYPPDLETMVKGVPLGSTSDKRIRFLRAIPTDPITGRKDWQLYSVQDPPDATKWNGKNVFDVRSTSHDTALDGTKYSDW